MEEGDDYVALTPVVPPVFIKLAEFYHLDATTLASLLLMDFCQHPPKNPIIIERGSPCEPLRSSFRRGPRQ